MGLNYTLTIADAEHIADLHSRFQLTVANLERAGIGIPAVLEAIFGDGNGPHFAPIGSLRTELLKIIPAEEVRLHLLLKQFKRLEAIIAQLDQTLAALPEQIRAAILATKAPVPRGK